jgi:hypothetical protein
LGSQRGEQLVDLLGRGHDQGRVQLVEQVLALAGGQLDVHRHREDAPAQELDHQLGVRHRAGDEQRDAGLGVEAVRIHVADPVSPPPETAEPGHPATEAESEPDESSTAAMIPA